MPIRTAHKITDRTWFVTFTNFNWIPLFEITNSYDEVYKWFKLIRHKYKIETLAFVIMPNHVHALLYLNDDTVDLNTVIGNAKRFMAYEIVRRLKVTGHPILDTLAGACSIKQKAKGQLHKVFEPSFDAKAIFTLDLLHQKLTYIHHNPVSKKWSLCTEYTDYLHSSAAFYELEGKHPNVDIVHYAQYWY